jgi:hypothetical protein
MAAGLLAYPGVAEGQPVSLTASVDPMLVGTWTLESIEETVDGKPARPTARGLLIFDAAGHAFESIVRGSNAGARGAGAGGPAAGAGRGTGAGRGAGGAAPAAAPAPAPTGFAAFSGFWGSYRLDAKQQRVTYRPDGAVSPNLMGRDLTRAFTVSGDRLTITSLPDEPHLGGATKWTWEKVPNVENISPGYRQVLGFWQHVVEKRVNITTGVTLSETRRAPSIIVYTPSGYVGVHFPPLNRQKFAGTEPTPEEAAAATRGYVGYFGALGVYPNMVFHQVLAGLSFQGTTLKRPFELTGQDLTIKFPPTTGANGEQTSTWVQLRRLSGADDMMPRPAR